MSGFDISKYLDRKLDGMKFGHVRVRCAECQDTGTVMVWTPETIKQAIRDPDNVRWRDCAVNCRCEAADSKATHWPERSSKRGDPVQVFGDQPWHINVRWHDSKAKAATYEHRSENYNDAFAEFENAE